MVNKDLACKCDESMPSIGIRAYKQVVYQNIAKRKAGHIFCVFRPAYTGHINVSSPTVLFDVEVYHNLYCDNLNCVKRIYPMSGGSRLGTVNQRLPVWNSTPGKLIITDGIGMITLAM